MMLSSGKIEANKSQTTKHWNIHYHNFTPVKTGILKTIEIHITSRAILFWAAAQYSEWVGTLR